MKYSRQFWIYNLGIWSIVALFTATQLYLKSIQSGTEDPFNWWNIFWIQLLVWWVWAFITPAIFQLANRYRFDRKKLLHGIAIHLPLAVGIVLLYLVIYTSIWLLANQGSVVWSSFQTIYTVLFVNLFHWHFFIYMAIIGIVHAYLYYKTSEEERRKGIELERALLSSQLKMLKMQLQPHFLFNTLNSIVSAIHQEKPQVASDMTTGLSELLRTALNENERIIVSLAQELKYVRTYLAIEQHRFKRLVVTYNIDESTLVTEVPNFFLQPLVENAIKHGIAQDRQGRILA